MTALDTRIPWLREPASLGPLPEELRLGSTGTRYLDCRDGEITFDDGKKARFVADRIFYASLTQDSGAVQPIAVLTRPSEFRSLYLHEFKGVLVIQKPFAPKCGSCA